MSQVLHILRKDLRRLRWPLIVWGVILIAQVVLSGVGAAAAGTPFAAAIVLRELSVMLAALQTLMLALLVARLVHDEPLVGLNAFWLTRPYSSRALFSAKLLFVAVVLVLAPLVADLATMSMFHAGPGAQLYAAPTFAASHLTWALGLWVVAALTPSLAAFVLTLIGVVVGLVVTVLLLISVTFALGLAETSFDGPMIPDPTPGIISLVVFIAATLVVIVYQYRRRRWPVAAALATAGLVAAGVVPAYWPWPFLQAVPPDPGQWARDAQATQVTIDPRFSLDVSRDIFEPGYAPRRRIHTLVQLAGMPAQFATQGMRVSGMLTLPDGTILRTSQAESFSVPGGATGGIVLTTRRTPAHAAMGGIDILNDVEERFAQRQVLLSMSEEEYARLKGQTGRFDATIEFRLFQTRVRGTLPLNSGAASDDGQSRVELVRAQPIEGGYRLVVRYWQVLPLTASRSVPRFEFFLRNRRERSAVALGRETSWSGSFAGASRASHVLSAALGNFSFSSSPSGFAVQSEALEFPWRMQGGYVGPAKLDPGWFDDAELVVLETVYAGAVTRSVSLPDFEIPVG